MRIVEESINALIRLVTSLAIPAWGLTTLGLGLQTGVVWWIVSGAATTLAGTIILIGSPLVRRFAYDA
jgi:hypothetical protein